MRVLVVEDEVDIARALCQALEEDGYAVDVARDGEAGLFAATGCDYAAAVLDLMLPKRDGLGVLRELRRIGRTIPVLILTAKDTLRDKVAGLDTGADDYLAKPFQIEELLARVRALIRRSSGQASPFIQIGDVEIDTVAAIVRKEGRAIDLAPKEYALIDLLARNRGKLISRGVIYNHIYDDNDETFSNVVDVYVSNLRRKLGKDFISTRRGQGYMIDV